MTDFVRTTNDLLLEHISEIEDRSLQVRACGDNLQSSNILRKMLFKERLCKCDAAEQFYIGESVPTQLSEY